MLRQKFYDLSFVAALVAGLMLAGAVWSAPSDITYQRPPEAIAKLIEAGWTPSASVSPDGTRMMIFRWPGLPPIEQVAQPEQRLAGLRFNPATNGPSRGWLYNQVTFQNLPQGEEQAVTGLPERPQMTYFSWSPDGRYVAFTNVTREQLELWLIDVDKLQARRLTDKKVNGIQGNPVDWFSDSRSMIVRLVPDDRGDAPQAPLAPAGPIVQENLGGKRPAATYQDMLKNPHDEALFDYYATSQLARVSLDGTVAPIGTPTVFDGVQISPDGNYLLVESIHRPYSYALPLDRFPVLIEVWDSKGAPVHLVADIPMAEEIPITYGSVRTGPRSVGWRNDVAATLAWVEALDGGDAGAEAEFRDQLFTLKAPFTGKPVEHFKMDLRFEGVIWGNDDVALAYGWWWSNRKTKTWLFAPGSPRKTPKIITERSFQDRYADPGNPVTHPGPFGAQVIALADNGKTFFLSGSGASPEGDRPFFDEYTIASGKTTRLFHSEAPYYESMEDLLDVHSRTILTRREAVEEPPNYYVRNLTANTMVAATAYPDPTPQLRGVSKELIKYTRADGVELSGTLYLPPGYDKEKDGPLPMLMWAYPNEFKSADAAGQVQDSPYRFVRVWWSQPMLWLLHGYAVLDDPTMPIVGEGDAEPNDTYVDQLVSSAKAAIDEVVARGVADRERIAVGGHSYGAFMTANLLAHSDLFAAGIARSGAYNRTLTPFGFQSEERTFWEAPEVYATMSPFMHADRINEPLLMIHGAADNNSGTFPMQSERMYAAMQGLGGTARLVMLPHESHGYQGKESVMHCLWEMTEWLDTYVKNRQVASDDQRTTVKMESN